MSWARPASGAGRRLRGGAWMKLRHQVLAEEGYCYLCGGPGQPDDEVDHVLGVSAGGGNERANLRRAHKRCNQAKRVAESGSRRR